MPQSQWSAADLVAQAAAEGLAAAVSRSTVQRWLEEDATRPWRYRSWIFPRDRQFAVKADRVLELYQRIWESRESRELGDGEYVISTDEMPQLQVLSRCHPGLPPAPGRAGRFEFEYQRHGTVAYLAAYDVHRAHLMGRWSPRPGIALATCAAVPVHPGGFVRRAAATPHYHGARADAAEPAIKVVSGIGPVRQEWVDPAQPVLRRWQARPVALESRSGETVAIMSSRARSAPGSSRRGPPAGDTLMLISLGGRRDLGWLSNVMPKSGLDLVLRGGRYKI